MSGESQRGLSDIIQTAFSFPMDNYNDDDSKVEFIKDVSRSPVPFTTREDKERPFGSFKQGPPTGGDSPKTKEKMATSSSSSSSSSSSTPWSGSITIGGRVINVSTTARTHYMKYVPNTFYNSKIFSLMDLWIWGTKTNKSLRKIRVAESGIGIGSS
jgi:hypothetical protein